MKTTIYNFIVKFADVFEKFLLFFSIGLGVVFFTYLGVKINLLFFILAGWCLSLFMVFVDEEEMLTFSGMIKMIVEEVVIKYLKWRINKLKEKFKKLDKKKIRKGVYMFDDYALIINKNKKEFEIVLIKNGAYVDDFDEFNEASLTIKEKRWEIVHQFKNLPSRGKYECVEKLVDKMEEVLSYLERNGTKGLERW